MEDYKNIIDVAINAAKKAGSYILEEKTNLLKLEKKADKTFVTHADKAAENIIREIIEKDFPDHEIFGEEHGHTKKESDFIWYVDPIDGTHNYMKGLPFYAVSIGVAYKDEVVAGVIFMPEFDELYQAVKDKGAFLNNKKLDLHNHKEVKTSVSLEFGGSIENKKFIRDFFIDTIFYNFSLRKLGSTACDMALVAKGSISSHISMGLKPYDFAAGIIIIKESGGILNSFKNNENKPLIFQNNIVSSTTQEVNDKIFEKMPERYK